MMKTLLALILGLATLTPARAQSADRIGFVLVSVTDGSVTLIESAARPGRLKQTNRHPAPGKLSVEVLSGRGQVVWQGFVEDPLLGHVEYVDENGRLARTATPRQSATMMLRVPVSEGQHRLRFYRHGTTAGKAPVALGTILATF